MPPHDRPGAPKPDGDAQHRIVTGFRNPEDAWLSQAKITQGEAHTWGIFLNRHARRARRNAHRVAIATTVALATRSEDAWGSREAAEVARGSSVTPGGMLDTLLGTAPTAKPPAQNLAADQERGGS